MYSYTNRRNVLEHEVPGLTDPKKGPKPAEVRHKGQNRREMRA